MGKFSLFLPNRSKLVLFSRLHMSFHTLPHPFTITHIRTALNTQTILNIILFLKLLPLLQPIQWIHDVKQRFFRHMGVNLSGFTVRMS